MPKLTQLKKIQDINSNNLPRVASQIQDNVADINDQLRLNPFLLGNMKQVTFQANTDIYVNHGLGHNYVGFQVFTPTAYGRIKLSDTVNKSPDKFLILTADSDMSAAIWVF